MTVDGFMAIKSCATIVWFIAIVALTIVEAATVALVSLWFILGAVVALILNLCGASITTQIIVFLAVSIVSMLIIRPVMKHQNEMKSSAELNSLVGKECKVSSNKEFEDYTVKVDDSTWNAKCEPGTVANVGDRVTITRVLGNTLIIQGVSIDSLTGNGDTE